ncbi:MAG: T9SS type A sorting domain-containing protein [Bernardetiaceae bacterium]|nr:T9SS type A sorting domain-containing protein [Bernardetiaceae bacterium]
MNLNQLLFKSWKASRTRKRPPNNGLNSDCLQQEVIPPAMQIALRYNIANRLLSNTNRFSLFVIALLFFALTAQNLKAQDVSSSPGTTFGGLTPTIIDPSITVTDLGFGTLDNALVSFQTPYTPGEDVLACSACPLHGITAAFNAATGVLTLSGTATVAQYEEVLQSITYQNLSGTPPIGDAIVFNFTLGDALPFTPCGVAETHFYKYVPDPQILWTDARVAAAASTHFGLQGYLVTIMCEDENDFAFNSIGLQGWIGASDNTGVTSGYTSAVHALGAPIDNEWFWVTGPEEGTQFWYGRGAGPGGFTPAANTESAGFVALGYPATVPGGPVGGFYSNWNAGSQGGEPNNFNEINESYGHFLATGLWNDYPNFQNAIQGYYVEYGGMPGDPDIQITDVKELIVGNPITPAGINPTGLGLWLNPNINLTADGADNLTNWDDVNQLVTGETFPAGAPSYNADAYNGNPTVSIGGSNYISYPGTNLLTGATEGEVFYVARANGTTNNGGLGEFSGDGAMRYGNGAGDIVDWFGSNAAKTWTPSIPLNRINIYNSRSATNNWAARINAFNEFADAGNVTSFGTTPSGHSYVGASHMNVFNGDISEVIVLTRVLTAVERNQVESYLASKYGITKNGDYIDSEETVYWDATTEPAYHNRVTVIGHEPAENGSLNQQLSSFSEEAMAHVRLSHVSGDFPASEINYAAFGDNAGAILFTDPAGAYNSMQRVWRMQTTGASVGNVRIRAAAGSVGNPTHIVYKAADTDFDAGATFVALTEDGTDVYADLPSGNYYFTFAKTMQGPGGVTGGIGLWLDPSVFTDVDGDDNLTNWDDVNRVATDEEFENTGGGGASPSPTLIPDSYNGYPTVSMGDAYLTYPETSFMGTATESGEVFVVARANSLTNNGGLYEVAGDGPMLYGNATGQVVDWFGSDAAQTYSPTTTFRLNRLNIYNAASEVGTWDVRFNALETFTGANNTSFGSTPSGNTYIGASHVANIFNGDIAEVVIFANKLSPAERIKVDSYLAAKFGITKVNNYVTSDDVVRWDATANAAYHRRVTVIGHDANAGLTQQITSRSIETGNAVRISYDEASGATFPVGSISYWAIGDNNGSMAYSNLNPTDSSSYMGRVWKVENATGVAGNIQISVPASMGAEFIILRNTDANFADFASNTDIATTAVGGQLVVNIPATTAYFTFGKTTPPVVPTGGGGTGGGVTIIPQPDPVIFTAVAQDPTTITLTWNAVPPTGPYEIYRRKQGTDEWVLVGIFPAGSGTFDDTGLDPDTYYEYRFDAAGRSTFAREYTYPEEPTAIVARGACDGSATALIEAKGTHRTMLFNWYESLEATTPFARNMGSLEVRITETTTFYVTAAGQKYESTPRTEVVVSPVSTPVAAFTNYTHGIERITCESSTVIAVEDQGNDVTYTWIYAGRTIAETVEPSLEVTRDGVYQVLVSRQGCSASASIRVRLNYKPTARIMGLGLRFCDSGVLTAAPVEDATYEWFRNGTSVATTQEPALTITEGGQYSVVVTQYGCQATSNTVEAEVFQLPTPEQLNIMLSAQQYCPGEPITLSVDEIPGATYRWRRDGSNIGNFQGRELMIRSREGNGEYRVRISFDGFGGSCYVDSDPVIVEYIDAPVSRVVLDRSNGELEIQFEREVEVAQIRWFYEFRGEREFLPEFDNMLRITPIETGFYGAEVTYGNGCMMTAVANRYFAEGGITGNEPESSNDFKMYPNPASSEVSLSGLAQVFSHGNMSLELYDALGRLVMQKTYSQAELQNTVTLNVSHLSRGTYLIKLNGERSNFVRKLIKE